MTQKKIDQEMDKLIGKLLDSEEYEVLQKIVKNKGILSEDELEGKK
ncbi:hypothetical protein [Methanolacinia paynteri]|nr:hypothetical protein [Methanolacinia paynteri]